MPVFRGDKHKFQTEAPHHVDVLTDTKQSAYDTYLTDVSQDSNITGLNS